jgi:type IV fimbrial biogenesis protein FimT
MLEVKPVIALTKVGERPIAVKNVQRGFTLIELMVTLAIAVIAMGVGVPSFMQFLRSANLSDATSNFMTAANTARAQAMKSGVNTFLVPRDVGVGWISGWVVYTDKNWNSAYDAGTDELITQHDAVSSDIAIAMSGAANGPNTLVDKYLLFNGAGFPRMKNGGFSNGTAEFSNADRTTKVIFDQTGRVRTCKSGATGC